MADTTDQILSQLFENLADPWVQATEAALRQVLKNQNIEATGELINSLKMTFMRAQNQSLGMIRLEFAQYGRFRDMKKLEYARQPPFDEILKWVQGRGVSSFAYVPGTKSMIDEETAARRIAWGVARGKYQKGIMKRTRSQMWYRAIFRKHLNAFQSDLAKQYAALVGRELKKSFQ